MATIDIPLPDALKGPLTPPLCADFGLPHPNVPQIVVPTGAALAAIADFTRGIPTDCSMNFSLMLMLGPIMASIECPLKILKLVGDLISAAEGGQVTKLLSVLTDAKAALQACLGLVTPLGICPFVKSILLLILRILDCFLKEMKSVLALMSGLTISLASANANGNIDEAAALQCALQNAQNTAAGAMSALDPVTTLLTIAQPFFAIAGIQISPIPSVTISGPGDLQGLLEVVQTLTTVEGVLQDIVQALPC